MTMDDVRILIGRVAYVFPVDDLRLSALSMRPVIEHILRMFSFNSATIGTPQATFGEVPETVPPGVAFSVGQISLEGFETPTPIRFLHFEQHRLVVDVAGTTEVAEMVLQQLSATLQDVALPDGSNLIGTPSQKLYYSEISAHCSGGIEQLFIPEFRTLLDKYIVGGSAMQLAPSISLPLLPSEHEINAVDIQPSSKTLQLSYRMGTSLGERRLWSGAPLTTEQHMAYLTELDALLATTP